MTYLLAAFSKVVATCWPSGLYIGFGCRCSLDRIERKLFQRKLAITHFKPRGLLPAFHLLRETAPAFGRRKRGTEILRI